MEEDVMADFLKRNRAEVVKMCLYEYDEERQRELDRERGREEGRQELLEEQIRTSIKKGYSKEMVADFLGVDLETIKAVIAGLVQTEK